jgi:chromosome segregation ATPase
MSTLNRLESAIKRLVAAIDQLEAASERRMQAEAQRADLEEELAVMQDDRSRLAVELDGAVARSKSLESANNEVSRRLQKASATIRTVLSTTFAER